MSDTIATDHDAAVEPGAHLDEHENSTHVSDKNYGIIALILAVITALEVMLSYIDVGWLMVPALLILMAIKFFTVAAYFMHLKFDNRIFTWMFYSGLCLAVVVYVGTLLTFHYFGK